MDAVWDDFERLVDARSTVSPNCKAATKEQILNLENLLGQPLSPELRKLLNLLNGDMWDEPPLLGDTFYLLSCDIVSDLYSRFTRSALQRQGLDQYLEGLSADPQTQAYLWSKYWVPFGLLNDLPYVVDQSSSEGFGQVLAVVFENEHIYFVAPSITEFLKMAMAGDYGRF